MSKQKPITQIDEEKLKENRQKMGFYSILELCKMFGCGRYSVDTAIENGALKAMSPNNRIQFIRIDDFLKFMEIKKEDSNNATNQTNQATSGQY